MLFVSRLRGLSLPWDSKDIFLKIIQVYFYIQFFNLAQIVLSLTWHRDKFIYVDNQLFAWKLLYFLFFKCKSCHMSVSLYTHRSVSGLSTLLLGRWFLCVPLHTAWVTISYVKCNIEQIPSSDLVWGLSWLCFGLGSTFRILGSTF